MKKQAFNPYLPTWEFIPDGEPYVFGDRVYIYGSHDAYNGFVFCPGDYTCWSAPVDDLGNWRCEGVIYPKTADPLNKDGRAVLYAPDVTVGPDGRYYLYYVLDKFSVVSVAVCDTPAGKYEFYGYVHYADGTRLGDREGDEPQFDPGVITENGKTILYTGFCGRGMKDRHGAMVTVLGEDMLTIERDPEIIIPGVEYADGTCFEGHAFFEAPSIRKRGDKYYFIYSSTWMHELCYAVSDNPLGGFVYGGAIVSNCDFGMGAQPGKAKAMGGNNHGSIVEINGQWYIFYHRQTSGTWFSRQGCAEPIEFTADGLIPQVEITSCGLNGGALVGKGEYPAAIACNLYTAENHVMAGDPETPRIIQDGDKSEGYIVNIVPSTVIGFKYFNFRNVKKVSIWTRAYLHGDFLFKTAPDGEILASIHCENSNIWEKGTADIDLNGDNMPLYIEFVGSGNGQLRSVEFE